MGAACIAKAKIASVFCVRWITTDMILLLMILLCQDYGWNSYSSGVTRRIFNDDMSASIVLNAVPIAHLHNNQKLPLRVIPITNSGSESFAQISHFTIKPATAGTIVAINDKEYEFFPSAKARGLGLINVHGMNGRGQTIFGQIHFLVEK